MICCHCELLTFVVHNWDLNTGRPFLAIDHPWAFFYHPLVLTILARCVLSVLCSFYSLVWITLQWWKICLIFIHIAFSYIWTQGSCTRLYMGNQLIRPMGGGVGKGPFLLKNLSNLYILLYTIKHTYINMYFPTCGITVSGFSSYNATEQIPQRQSPSRRF